MEEYYALIEKMYDLSVITTLLPTLAAIFRWRFFNISLKIAAIHTFRGTIISLLALAFYYLNYANRPFYYISPCLDIVLISLLAASLLKVQKISYMLFTVSAVYLGLMAYDYFGEGEKTMISSNLTSAETVFVIVILLILLRKISVTQLKSSYRNSFIWILSALLIGNLFSFLVSFFNQKVLDYSNEMFTFWWYILSPAVIIFTNLMLARGFYLVKRPVKF